MKNQPAVAPLHPWPRPTRIWQIIHIDFAEKDTVNYDRCGYPYKVVENCAVGQLQQSRLLTHSDNCLHPMDFVKNTPVLLL